MPTSYYIINFKNVYINLIFFSQNIKFYVLFIRKGSTNIINSTKTDLIPYYTKERKVI